MSPSTMFKGDNAAYVAEKNETEMTARERNLMQFNLNNIFHACGIHDNSVSLIV